MAFFCGLTRISTAMAWVAIAAMAGCTLSMEDYRLVDSQAEDASSGDADGDGDGDSDADTDTDADTDSDTDAPPVTKPGKGGTTWVVIPGGSFQMGSDYSYEQPVHGVVMPTYEILETEVTAAQYEACWTEGACNETGSGYGANWGVAGRESYPVNFVSWEQANAFCRWVGGRLPSESEWEYAARGGGRRITYPWGDEEATCDYAVMLDQIEGCGADETVPVCGIPAGNTHQGLCDMSGNVWEWVQDVFHGSYDCDANSNAVNCEAGGSAPTDGSAWEGSGGERVMRGGSFDNFSKQVTTTIRNFQEPTAQFENTGFRCAREETAGAGDGNDLGG
jgi:formylglycine-generating enzyme